jgi:DNA-binding beta-propeller fold protein YncE
LTPIAGHTSIAAGTAPFSVAVDPSGRFAYATDYTGGNIYEYTIDPTNGFLTAIAGHASIATGTNPRTVAVDPYGKFAYVANYGSANVSQYTIDPTNGFLTAVTGFPTEAAGTNPYSVAVDPTGQFVYVANYNGGGAGSISQYAITQTTGALTPIAGSPVAVAAGGAPTAIAVDPLGTFLYVGDGSNNVSPYAIAGNGGLTAGSAYATGAAPRGIAVDPVSRYVYVSASDETVSIFSQSTPGVLALITAPYKISTGYGAGLGPPGPYQMAMMFGSSRATYVPKYAYVANNNSPSASQFTIDPATGFLSGGATATTGTTPQAVATDPFGRFAYVVNNGSTNVSQYTIGLTGVLTPDTPATQAAGTSPQAVAVDPSGRFAYVADGTTDNNVSQYTINQITGVLSVPATIGAGTGPYSVAVDPAGRFVYVANNTSANISEYAITQTTGALSAVAGSPVGGAVPLTAAQVVAVEPLGRFAYVALSTGSVYAYSIDLTAGGLTVIGGAPVATGLNPRAIAFDPLGRFAYVACNSGNVYVFSIGATGALTVGVPQASIGVAGAWGVSVDPSGQYAYVTKSTNANSVSVFSINQATGALTDLLSPATTGNTPEGIAVVGTIQ